MHCIMACMVGKAMAMFCQGSAMATVNASGSVWSAVYLDHASSKGDQEGFLIGDVVRSTTTNISDSQISSKTEQVSINIYSHYSCTEPFSFYDYKGNVDQGRLLAMLKDNYRNVVGWYQMRRNVPQEPTLRDLTLHRQLLKILRNVSPNTFILALFSTNLSWNQAIHSILHQFFTITNSGFTTIPLAVFNLGETAQTEYRLSSSASSMGSTPNSTYAQILNTFKPKLLEPAGTVEGVQKVHQLSDTLHKKLKALTSNVHDSEKQVQRLTDEVSNLERRVQRQRREHQQQAATARAANGNPSLPIVVRPSSQPPAAAFFKSSPTQNTILQETAPPVPPHRASSSHRDIVDSCIATDKHKTIAMDSRVSLDKNMRIAESVAEVQDDAMDTTPVKDTPPAAEAAEEVLDPNDPFAGLLADMKKSIPVKRTPLKKASSFKGKTSAMGDGPRSDRSNTFPQLNDAEAAGGSQSSSTSSTSSPNKQFLNRRGSPMGNELDSGSETTSQGGVNSRYSPQSMQQDNKGNEEEEGEGEEGDDDDATQMTGEFQYTQSGSPTF